MEPHASSVESRLQWEDVLAAASRREGERSFLSRLLQYFCQQYSLSAAALYARSDERYERQVATGGESFPASMRLDETSDYPAVELPAGLLLHTGAETPELKIQGPLVLALSSALHALVLRQALKQESFAVNYRGVELEALYDVGLAIASMLNLEQIGEESLLRAVSLLDARRGALYLRDGNFYRLDHTFGGDALGELALDDPVINGSLQGSMPDDQVLLPDAQYLMAVPIGNDPQPQGLLVVADKESRRGVGPFPDADKRTLALFANQAAIALETARLHQQMVEKERLERELELAAEIQRRLLPTVFPRIEGYELAGWSRPARHVGGDYYDLMRLENGRIAAVLADVSGKGMPAALMVSTVHSALRLLVDQVEVGPTLTKRLNRHISESSAPNKFITLFLAELDPAENVVRYVNAGHNPGFLVRPGGEVVELKSGGLPLGLFEGGAYEAGSVELRPGDLLCLYSDGITECTSPDDEEFEQDRLIELLRSSGTGPLSKIVGEVDRAVREFAGGLSQGDDQTLVLIRRSE